MTEENEDKLDNITALNQRYDATVRIADRLEAAGDDAGALKASRAAADILSKIIRLGPDIPPGFKETPNRKQVLGEILREFDKDPEHFIEVVAQDYANETALEIASEGPNEPDIGVELYGNTSIASPDLDAWDY